MEKGGGAAQEAPGLPESALQPLPTPAAAGVTAGDLAVNFTGGDLHREPDHEFTGEIKAPATPETASFPLSTLAKARIASPRFRETALRIHS